MKRSSQVSIPNLASSFCHSGAIYKGVVKHAIVMEIHGKYNFHEMQENLIL